MIWRPGFGVRAEITPSISCYAGDETWESVSRAMTSLIIEAANREAWDFSEEVTIQDPNYGDLINTSLRPL